LKPHWEAGLILRVRSGSRAYGLDEPDSDEDSRGVCIPGIRYLLGLERFEQHESEGKDHVVHALAKFAQLGLQGNPNIVETLFTPRRHVLFVNGLGERLLAAREWFLSRRLAERFLGYAGAQRQRMDRQRERIGRGEPRPERNPARRELEERFGFDTKHAMHLLRLLRMGEEILRGDGVRVERSDAAELRAVRAGEVPYESIVEEVDRRSARIRDLAPTSPLPDRPDEAAVEELVIELHLAGLGLEPR